MRATLGWPGKLARPARSLKLFGTFLTFLAFFLLTVSHILFGLICWLGLSLRPAQLVGQLQLSSWLTTLVARWRPYLASIACSFLCWMLHYLGGRNKLKNVWNTFRQLGSTYNFLQNWILNSARKTQRKQSAVAAAKGGGSRYVDRLACYGCGPGFSDVIRQWFAIYYVLLLLSLYLSNTLWHINRKQNDD